jgi:hypothetical protein
MDEFQVKVPILVIRSAAGAVAGQEDVLPQGHDDPFLMQFQSFKVECIDKNIPGIPQIGDGGREESLGGENRVIIPPFDPESLQEFQSIKTGVFQITVQQGEPGPADLGQITTLI